MYTRLEKKNKKVLIIYATTSGNAELVAEAISDGVNDADFTSVLSRAEKSNVEILKQYEYIFLVSSTWNVGLLNENMIKLNNQIRESNLEGKFFQVVGLGDSKNYDIFCGAADILEESVLQSKGKLISPTLRIDGAVAGRLLEFREWTKSII